MVTLDSNLKLKVLGMGIFQNARKFFEFPLLSFRVSERKLCVGNTCFAVISSVSDFLHTNSIILTQNSFSKAIKSKLTALVADNTANVTALYVIITLKMSAS